MESSWKVWNLEAKKKKLTSTLQETLELFLSKKTLKEIEKQRGFKEETIQIQIIELITKSLIDINDVISRKHKEEIDYFIEKNKNSKLSEIKAGIDDKITYFEIKCVIAHLNSLPQKVGESKKSFFRGSK